jgi:hypothetical protein
VLADFIMEWTETQMLPAAVDEEYWTMYFDGSLMKQGDGLGLIFCLPTRRAHEVRDSRSFPHLK